MMLLMQLIPTNHTVQDGELNHMGRHARWKCKLIVPAQQGALPHWTGCQSDAAQTFLCVYMKTWTSLWKRILPGSFSVNTPLVSFIVNSEQRPASGIVSTPLPGNNRDGIFPSVCSYVTSSSSPSLPSASSTLESVHTSLCNMIIFCYLFHSGIKKKFQPVFIVLSWVSLSAGSCYDPTNLCIRGFEHNPAGIRVHTFGSWSVCLWEFGVMRIGESADTWQLK